MGVEGKARTSSGASALNVRERAAEPATRPSASSHDSPQRRTLALTGEGPLCVRQYGGKIPRIRTGGAGRLFSD